MPRPRLVAALEAAARHRATSVCAPAGYGKSVLLAEWAQTWSTLATRRGVGRLAWLRLDHSDDVDDRFCHALASALVRVGAVGPDVRTAAIRLHSPIADSDLVDFLGGLLDSVVAGRRQVMLLLDDAHVLTNHGVLRAVDYLLEYAPSTLHLVMAQRTEPLLRLQRLRLAGELTTIEADDLAFTRAETAELLKTCDVVLPACQVAVIHDATWGWCAGVALSALWLARSAGPADRLVLAVASGSVTADYLRREVLHGLPSGRRRALRRLATVAEFDSDLAAVLAGSDAVHALPDELCRASLFLTPTDPADTWYRWHPLLRAVLHRELADDDPAEARTLHRTAAIWLSEHGRLSEAIRHATQTDDRRFLAELVSEHWLELTVTELRNEAGAALDAVPREIMTEYPELSIAAAAVRIAEGNLPEALPLAEEALSRLDRAPTHRKPLMAAMAAGIRLYCADLGEPPKAAREAVILALHGSTFDAVPPPAADAARRFLTLALAASDQSSGPATSFAELRHLMGDPHGVGSFANALDAHARLSALTWVTGTLDAAASQAHEVIKESHGHSCESGHAVGVAALTLGWVDFLRGNDDAAGEHVRSAAQALAEHNDVEHCLALRLQTLLLIRERSLDEARMVLHRAYALRAVGTRSARVEAALRATEADLLLAEGDYLEILRLAADGDLANDPTPYRPAFVVAADAHLHLENPRAGIQLLAPWLNRTDVGLATQISVRMLQAVAEVTLGRTQAALASVSAAVRLAAPEDLVRPLLDNLHPLYEQLAELADSDLPESDFLGRLLAATESERIFYPRPTRLPQPLTPREQDILRYLRSRLSLVEIAGILRLSPNTVKTHVKHIYEKLQVTGRQEAVQRAADFKLL